MIYCIQKSAHTVTQILLLKLTVCRVFSTREMLPPGTNLRLILNAKVWFPSV